MRWPTGSLEIAPVAPTGQRRLPRTCARQTAMSQSLASGNRVILDLAHRPWLHGPRKKRFRLILAHSRVAIAQHQSDYHYTGEKGEVVGTDIGCVSFAMIARRVSIGRCVQS